VRIQNVGADRPLRLHRGGPPGGGPGLPGPEARAVDDDVRHAGPAAGRRHRSFQSGGGGATPKGNGCMCSCLRGIPPNPEGLLHPHRRRWVPAAAGRRAWTWLTRRATSATRSPSLQSTPPGGGGEEEIGGRGRRPETLVAPLIPRANKRQGRPDHNVHPGPLGGVGSGGAPGGGDVRGDGPQGALPAGQQHHRRPLTGSARPFAPGDGGIRRGIPTPLPLPL